ncbi:MAG: C1 family peptidase, partial [Planctomycetota bacterium]|nr:C1 family peptidase [Planctomycetota bacterium]
AGDCSGGWHTDAFEFLKPDGETDPCGDSGAVPEADFPYGNAELPCDCPYPHAAFLDTWFFVGVPWEIATVEQIKQAIYERGPVATCVYANDSFIAYNGGVFNDCEDHWINHVVVLVGWDDNEGTDGVWILRNSYGPGWGEDGYMRIEYGCSRIGYATCYLLLHDCNGNGVPDEEDLANGTSQDCNENGIPDECDIADGTSEDCNGNGIPDECDIADGVSLDCNENGRPDECDIADGTSEDCNENSVPDECDVADGTSEDCNENNRPDECDLWAPRETAKVTASDGAEGDYFGRCAAISGDAAIVGAHDDDDSGQDSGSAYVFRLEGAEWMQDAKLLASDGAAGDEFGAAVAISGDVAVVGARDEDAGGEDAGAAYVFRFDGSAWNEEAKLTASDGAAADIFGCGVAIDGDIIIVGAQDDDDLGDDSGAAYIYRFDGSLWEEGAKLLASDGEAGDEFGCAVAISGDVVIIGAKSEGEGGANAGAAYAYRFDGSEWVEEAKLVASDAQASDYFGHAVSISDEVVVVAAAWNDDLGDGAGAAYVYHFEEGLWTERAKLLASDGADGDKFGFDVGVSDETIIVGARSDDDLGSSSGSMHLYRYLEPDWVEVNKFLASDGAESDQFGYAVAIDGNNGIVGAYKDDDHGDSSGSAYLYDGLAGADCNENGVPDDCDIADGTSGDCNGNGIPDECDIADGTSQDEDGNGIPDECVCLGDLDGDWLVSTPDLLLLLGAWDTPDGDLNDDGTTNTVDLLLLLGAWGECPE